MKDLRVLNTRPLHQSEKLDMAIRSAGGISINMPALTISPTPIDWLNNMPELITVMHAIFISANAVNYYFSALQEAQISFPTSISVIAVGRATAAALSQQGIVVHHVPDVADSEHLLELDALQNVHHQKI